MSDPLTWQVLLGGIVGSIPGVLISRWLGYRDGKKAALKEKAADAPSHGDAGPYRTPAERTDLPPIRREWRFLPRASCPRCGGDVGDVRPRGRFTGDHTYFSESRHLSARSVECGGHPSVPHLHYQCYECGADWAEIPPEEYA